MHTIVLGAGLVGENLAEALYREGYDVTLVDRNGAALEHAAENLDIRTLEGHGADPEILGQAGVREADFFMAVTDMDEVNLLACLAAKEMGALITVARVTNRVYLGGRRALYRNLMGVDIVVSPENLAALEVAKHARAAGVVALESLTGGALTLREVEVIGKPASAGVLLKDLKLPGSVLLAIIMRNGSATVPGGDDLVRTGDDVFMLGYPKEIRVATKQLGKEVGTATRALIVGGGQVGLLAGQSLVDLGVDVRLIEKDPARARLLSESIKGEVLCGDGTDVNLLREAGVDGIDLFVSAAGLDELNLVLGMLAAELGAKKRVILVKRRDFEPIVERLSVDAAISPRVQTAEAIIRYIRRPKFSSLASVGGSAEMLDTLIGSGSRMKGRRLSDVELPPGVLLGAVIRGDDVLIPKGETVMQPGDNVVLFADASQIEELESMF